MKRLVYTICFLLPGFLAAAQSINPSGTVNLCTGKSQLLTVVNGAGPYQWMRDEVKISGATSINYTANQAGNYSVIINGGKNEGDTLGPVKVIVNPYPSAAFSFSPTGQCSNVPVFFTNNSTGGATYLWNFGDPNSGAGNSATAASLSHVFVGTPGNVTQNFVIKLVTKTAAGCADSITHTITTKQVPSGRLGGTGAGSFQGQEYFSVCGDLTSADFTFSNQTSTSGTNTGYKIVWGDGSPDFNPGINFNSTVNHTYPSGTHTLLSIVSGQNGCVDTTEYGIFVGTNPAVGLANPGNTAVCAGSTLTFPITGTASNPPGTLYEVTFNDGSPAITYVHPNVPASVSHLFQVTSCGTSSSNGTLTYPNAFSASIVASNPCNSSAATIVPIYVSEKPNASFTTSPNDTICVNNLLTLDNTSKGSSAYQGECKDPIIVWSVTPTSGWTIQQGSLGDDFNTTTPAIWQSGSDILKLRFSLPGTYTVSLKTGNTYCGINETTQTICVNPAPTVNYALDKTTGCAPLTVNTNTTYNDPTCGKNQFIWVVDYTAASECGTFTGDYVYLNGTDSSSAEPVFQFNDPGVYALRLVMVSPGGTCSTTVATKTVTVKTKPKVTVSSIPAELCQFGSIEPSASIQCYIGNAATTLWSFPGGKPASATTPDPGKITYDTAGNYAVTLAVTNSCGTTTFTHPIVVHPTPKITVPSDISVCAGESAGPLNFTSAPSGAAFTWTNSNTGIGLGADGSSNPIPAFTTINTGSAPINATIKVNATLGSCSSSESFVITVGAMPEAPVVQHVEYCLNDAATPLSATATSGNTLLWYTNATGGTGNASSPTPATTSVGVTTYYVSQVAINTQCEGPRVPINVSVNPIPVITSTSSVNPSQCATATGRITLSGLEPAEGYLVYYTKDGIPASSQIRADGVGNVVIPYLTAGNYSNLYVTLSGCPSAPVGPFILADPNPPAAPQAGSNSPLCAGSTLSLTADATGTVTYQWTGPKGFSSNQQNPSISNVSEAEEGVYYVSVTQANCTSPTSSVNVVVNPLPAPPTTSPVTYCLDAVATPLTATGNSLLWYTTPSAGTGDSNAPTPVTSVSGSTNYYVSQTDANGCESERSELNVTIHPNATAEFTPTLSLYCPPFKITQEIIGLQEYPNRNSQYLWYINGVYAGSGTVFPGHTITAANDSATIKLVTHSLHGCQSDSMEHKFRTYKLPNPSFTMDNNEGCGPLSVLFTNTTEDISLYNYDWDFGNGHTSREVQPGTIIFLPNPTYGDTTYYIKLKMSSVCDTIYIEKSVHVTSKPKALFTPDITTGCSPMPVSFKNTSRGLGNTYYWDFGDGNTEVTNTMEPVTHTFYTGITDTFYVSLIAVNGCGYDTLEYAIIAAPNSIDLNVAMNGTDHYGCLPHTVAFVNNSSGANSFLWDFGDGNTLSTSNNIDTVYHTYLSSGDYSVSIRAQNNCSDTTAFEQVTVFPKPSAAFDASASRVCIGDTIIFSNQSSIATSYQWQFGDGATSVLENPTHIYTTPGLYTVQLIVFKSNAPGSICLDSITQQIQVVESLPGSFSMSDSVSTCAPLTVTFVNHTQPSVTAVWDFGDGHTASGDIATHTYLFSGNYTVTLTVTVSGGCAYMNSKTVKVNGPSGTLYYAGGNICYPHSVRLEATAANTDSFHWDFGDGNTSTTSEPVVYHTYEHPGNYLPSVSLSNAAGCNYFIKGVDTIKVDRIDAGYIVSQQQACGATEVIFTDTSHVFTGKNLVSWNFGDGNTANGTSVSHTYTTSGNYTVEMIIVSNSGCADTIRKQFSFHVNNIPVTTIEADDTACANLPVPLSALIQSTDSLHILQWNISNGVSATGHHLDYVFTTRGVYQIRFIAGTVNGCYDTAYHTIFIKPSPVVTAREDITLCKGNTAQLGASGGIQYQWSPLQGLSCTTCPNPIVTPEITTPYVVAGYNAVGCPDYDTVNVTVIPPLVLNTSGNDSICIGQSAHLLISGAASYVWTPATSLSSTTISNPVANPTITTTYRVIGYDGYHCFTDTAFITVAVGEYPTVALGPDQTLPTGTLLPLKSEVVNGPVKYWNWAPVTDLNCADCPLPIAHIKNDITYAVEITSVYGCSAADSIHINVFCESAQVFVPNAFSPDGDGVNDILMVRASGIALVKSFRVFNRWGELVFERNNFRPNEPSFGWDGRIRGKTGSAEVYVYTAEVICENGLSYVYKGNTTILK